MSEFLSLNAWHFMLVAARMITVFMNLPGIGERYVPTNVRLLIGIGTTIVVMPVVAPYLPPQPTMPWFIFAFIFNEILVGLIIGFSARVIKSATHTAGHIASMSSGLGIASMMDPSQGQQGAIVGALLGISATLLIFVLDLHHLMIASVRDSYLTFKPGQLPPFADLSQAHTRLVGDAFLLGFQISSPFIVASLVLYTAMGILSRLMPQIQVFFVVQPIQILLSLFVFMATFSAMLLWFTRQFEDVMRQFLGLS